MPKVITLKEIKPILKNIDVINLMQQAFIQYSNGNAVIPPVGELIFNNPPGDVHIKYGYIKREDFYVIKIASGFYENYKLDLPSGQGMMLLFSQKTGKLESILLDEGYLTNIRTAAAGALAVKHFSPSKIQSIGIIGSGIQARLQLEYIQKNNPCKKVFIWGRNKNRIKEFYLEIKNHFDVEISSSPSDLAKKSNVIITTTASESPLLKSDDIKSGTLIVAIGSDTENKQELDSEILRNADLVIGDSISQSKSRGEIFKALSEGMINEKKIVELGTAIQNSNLNRSNNQTIVVDLTGVAVQDIAIASKVYLKFLR
ncbi:MAG: ornithine cyclodeaminase [Candidatus Marivariicella framensis]|jgi:ornithine cyclodeaminase|tara:strand:- start:6403 stop:7347 length:945 start_codon:yes stop_codon:yes gene_type:complete